MPPLHLNSKVPHAPLPQNRLVYEGLTHAFAIRPQSLIVHLMVAVVLAGFVLLIAPEAKAPGFLSAMGVCFTIQIFLHAIRRLSKYNERYNAERR